jgi:hypothetical protein
MAYLYGLPKVNEEQLRNFRAGKTMPPEFERSAGHPCGMVMRV